mmetsp:Transcript_7887/g.19596  ORF Transcript_7887/g.19596 Transcript_7887/m.19596 type:complete len:193 (+) Transcript_7887:297-875(+)|eukprot:CAMPEP_0174895196 /NCGR_PEP_ID=MMETSP0167-20121228/9655_1 /TAXON_ID=38298 /ORGANISM="Rhodella maculata, Strain CCMP736" /LENGTH=192 /DNA_ID=CAMNT_0016134465 /DNA_START=236 /DNA_END=814 /DNA_ORIENTATION=+
MAFVSSSTLIPYRALMVPISVAAPKRFLCASGRKPCRAAFRTTSPVQMRTGSIVPNYSGIMSTLLDPFPSLTRLEQELLGTGMNWVPLCDVSETADAFIIKMDIPGMTRDDVNVQVKNGMLQVSGEKVNEFKDENVCKMERRYGSFSRMTRLPENVDLDNIKAEVKNGVLTVRAMKKEKDVEEEEGKVIQIE